MTIEITNSRYLAQKDTYNLVHIATITTVCIYLAQAISVGQNNNNWLTIFSISSIFLLTLSRYAQRQKKFQYLNILPLLNIFIAPIWIDNSVNKSWMSMGLITVVLCFSLAAIFKTSFSILPIIVIEILSLIIVKQDLISISDTNDLLSLGGYFAFVWNFGLMIAFIYARDNYNKVCDSIDSEISERYQRLINNYKRIAKLNLKDWRNIKLHGTILNTVISLRNSMQQKQNLKIAFDELGKNIDELEINNPNFSKFENDLISISNRPEFRDIDFKITGNGNFKNSDLNASYLEICREIFLNSLKHTDTSFIAVNFTIDDYDKTFFIIETNENVNSESSSNQSKTLDRLIRLINCDLLITTSINGKRYVLTSGSDDEDKIQLKNLQLLRNTGVSDFANDLLKGLALLSLATVVGFYFTDIPKLLTLLIPIQAILILITAFHNKLPETVTFISFAFSSILFILAFTSITQCSQSNFIPWFFQIVGTVCGISALKSRNTSMKWLPVFYLLISSIVLPILLPAGCQNILRGSVPGAIILPALVISYKIFRKKTLNDDSRNMLGIYNDEVELNYVGNLVTQEFYNLISECKKFYFNFKNAEYSENLLIESELLIQKIRNYLLSSEQFESKVVQAIYDFSKSRLDSGFSTRLNIIGEDFHQNENIQEFQMLIDLLNRNLKNESIQITLSNIPNSYLQIDLQKSNAILERELEKFESNNNRYELIINSN